MRVVLYCCMLAALSGAACAGDYVKGYMRSDGVYVQPHYRTSPNSSAFDNYGTKGNVNPYTGKMGTVDPYRPRQPSLGGAGGNYGTNYLGRR